jgi:probable rRNA maturation factor
MIHRVVAQSLNQVGQDLGDNVEISMTFVDNEAIRTLNREHRGVDKATDVLSFSQLEGEELGALPEGEPLPLGDIVISLERCAEQAGDYGHSFDRELGFLVCHGLLHLLGFDHQSPTDEESMMTTTEEILNALGLTRA